MSDMFFEEELGVSFTSLPDNDASPTYNVKQEQEQQQEEEPTQTQETNVKTYDDEPPQPQDSFDAPTPTQSRSAVTPPQSNGDHNYVMSNLTTVDGHGMWQSWTRVFDQPRYACLDLLDNCLDATLHPPEFDGKVVMKRLPPNGIAILNNSSKAIKPLKDVLVVYGSTKGVGSNAKRDAIGENGVGLKHGCATLSNTSFVLTRNENVYSMGVIAKTLQSREGVCLPSFEFVVEEPENKSPGEIESEITEHIQSMLTQNPKVAKCVQIDLGQGDLNAGIKVLVEHCQVMWDETWEPYDHVFQVLITSLLHSHNSHSSEDPKMTRRSFKGNNPAAMFLNEIKTLLPKFYVNIPLRGFEFIIENEKVQFSYWQHRLVELTKFHVHIPKETPIQDITHMNWDKDGYPLSVYCGFEALRVASRDEANAAHMYIYSRASGRLIQIDDDARATLGLAASGSDYQQGLTLIVDDVEAQLPLMPTKQGIAWSEQRGGETHKRNLLAWVAGVAHCYWQHHAKTFQQRCGRNDFKTLLQSAVYSMADPIRRHLHDLEKAEASTRANNNPNSLINRSLAMERLELADFTWFRDIDWKKSQNRASRKWRITKTFGQYNKLDIVQGSATIFKFTKEHYPGIPAAVKTLQEQRPVPPPYAPPARSLSQIQASVEASVTSASKKRRLSDGSNGAAASKPILLLDDDSDDSGSARKARAAPAPVTASPMVSSSQNGVRRQVARKSTGAAGGPSPQQMMRGNHINSQQQQQQHHQVHNHHGLPQNPHSMQLQMQLKACQAELERQKQMLVNEQLRNRDVVVRYQQDLQRANHANRQLQQQNQQLHQRQPAQQLPPPNYQANLQKAQDELTIVKRQKNKLEEELQEIKDQRATEVSGLNLEIEGLRMKLEQQDETIRRLQRDSENQIPDDSNGSNGFMTRGSMLRSKFSGTDSI